MHRQVALAVVRCFGDEKVRAHRRVGARRKGEVGEPAPRRGDAIAATREGEDARPAVEDRVL